MSVLFDIGLRLILAPLLIVQGLWVRRRAASLPEAAGARTGRCGTGKPLRLLLLGDSSMAGVGVEHLDQALPGHLCCQVPDELAIDWHLSARTGATTADAIGLIPTQERFDVAVLALGTNDVTHLVPRFLWLRQQIQLYTALRNQAGVRHVIITGLPPIRHFPLLPQPLRHVLGREADRFDLAIKALAARRSDLSYVTLEIENISDLIAADGFHPGPEIFRLWAESVAGALQAWQAGER